MTCGSVLKLKNMGEDVRLHSHEVKYGSGSGQQSVTGTPSQDDVNSHWQVLGTMNEVCSRGTSIKCGQKIRLYHLSTQCYLHSHDIPSPLSKQNEVSCYGKDGTGDSGDNWEVICDDEYWEKDSEISLKHVDTGRYLLNSGNQFGRPIQGQREIVGARSITKSSRWVIAEGVYMGESKKDEKKKDEL
uniref:MIR domain-containing protein n=1 Tax=Strongyloides venezuelensis TaxID=75913 RepID=A0A0K0F9F0_STRVS